MISSTSPETAVGRKATDEWTTEAVAGIRTGVQEFGYFVPRLAVGINYANADQVNSTRGPRSDMASHITNLLTELIDDPKINLPTGASLVRLRGEPVKFKPKSKGVFRIEVQLSDYADPRYECGYLIEGEKVALRAALGLVGTKRTSPKLPRHWIRLGTLYVPDRVSSEVKDRIREGVPRIVSLEKISPLEAAAPFDPNWRQTTPPA